MSTERKIDLCKDAREAGYKLVDILSVLKLPRSTWYYRQNKKVDYRDKYGFLMPFVKDVIENHPEYGYRRIRKALLRDHNIVINHKPLQRLLREWDLSLKRHVHKPSESEIRRAIRESGDSADLINGREEIGLFEACVTDFTDIYYGYGSKKAKLMVIVGYICKMIYGWSLGERRNIEVALKCWERAKQTLKRFNISWEGMIIHHDRDSVYTSHKWLSQLLFKDKVRVSYAMKGAKDNTAMEGFNSRFKDENHSIFWEIETLRELSKIIEKRINYYNEERLHSSIEYKTPVDYIKERK